MVVSAREYALLAGISQRAVCLRAENGLIKASKIGRAWIIDDAEVLALRQGKVFHAGRPLSCESFESLALFIDSHGDQLSPIERHRARQLLHRIIEHPVQELRRVSLARQERTIYYRASDRALAQLRELHIGIAAGLCAPHHPFSLGNSVDAYVNLADYEYVQSLGLLMPATTHEHNVLLRLCDEYPPRSKLRLWSDLLDYPSARIPSWCEEQVRIAATEVL